MKRDFKGIWIPADIWLDQRLTAIEKVLLAEVDSFTSRAQSYFKANDTIARDMGVSTSTAKRAVAKLIELDLIERTEFDGRRRGLRSKLTPSDRSQGAGTQVNETHQPAQSDPPASSKRAKSKQPNKTKKKTQEKIEMPLPGLEEAWGQWKTYKHTEHRFQFKSSTSELAALAHLAKIADHDTQKAITIIHTSIANGWKGLFPARNQQAGAPTAEDRDNLAAYLRTGMAGHDDSASMG